MSKLYLKLTFYFGEMVTLKYHIHTLEFKYKNENTQVK